MAALEITRAPARTDGTPPFLLASDDADHAIMGIDPGVTGGIAFLYRSGMVAAQDIPTAGGEVDADLIARTIRSFAPRFAVVERASAMPGQGVSSTFKFGAAYGALCAVVTVCRIPLHFVSPSVWKKHFHLDKDKEKSRKLAKDYWPGCGFFDRKKDHGRAEAALIARYGAECIERPRLRIEVEAA